MGVFKYRSNNGVINKTDETCFQSSLTEYLLEDGELVYKTAMFDSFCPYCGEMIYKGEPILHVVPLKGVAFHGYHKENFSRKGKASWRIIADLISIEVEPALDDLQTQKIRNCINRHYTKQEEKILMDTRYNKTVEEASFNASSPEQERINRLTVIDGARKTFNQLPVGINTDYENGKITLRNGRRLLHVELFTDKVIISETGIKIVINNYSRDYLALITETAFFQELFDNTVSFLEKYRVRRLKADKCIFWDIERNKVRFTSFKKLQYVIDRVMD